MVRRLPTSPMAQEAVTGHAASGTTSPGRGWATPAARAPQHLMPISSTKCTRRLEARAVATAIRMAR